MDQNHCLLVGGRLGTTRLLLIDRGQLQESSIISERPVAMMQVQIKASAKTLINPCQSPTSAIPNVT